MNNKNVHTEHCCVSHGCKYGDDDHCPVTTGIKLQSFPCENCQPEIEQAHVRFRSEPTIQKTDDTGVVTLDATEMKFGEAVRKAEDLLFSGTPRVVILVDDEPVMTLVKHSDVGTNAFWRPGRVVDKAIDRIFEENSSEIDKLRAGKKIRNVRMALLDELDRRCDGNVDRDYAQAVISVRLADILQNS